MVRLDSLGLSDSDNEDSPAPAPKAAHKSSGKAVVRTPARAPVLHDTSPTSEADDDEHGTLLANVMEQLSKRKGDSGKLTKQVDAAVKRSRAEMIESTAASREEFEGVKRAAEEAIRADAAKLEAATREFDKEAAEVARAIADLIKRNKASRKGVQRAHASAKTACSAVLEKHQQACAATVAKTGRVVSKIQKRRLPLEHLANQVVGWTESLEKDLGED